MAPYEEDDALPYRHIGRYENHSARALVVYSCNKCGGYYTKRYDT